MGKNIEVYMYAEFMTGKTGHRASKKLGVPFLGSQDEDCSILGSMRAHLSKETPYNPFNRSAQSVLCKHCLACPKVGIMATKTLKRAQKAVALHTFWFNSR